MKKLIPLLLVLASCSRTIDVAPGNSYQASLTGQTVTRGGGIKDMKLTINIQRADSAIKVEIARADYAYIYELTPVAEGSQIMYDYQINQNANQTSYVIKSTLLGGQVRTSQVFTVNH